MGIIEYIFGTDSGRKIYRKEFESAIKSLPNIDDREREYLRGIFAAALKDGIAQKELMGRIKMLQHNQNDILDAREVESVKRKLLGELEDNK